MHALCLQAAVETSESLGLGCPLHPCAADVAPMTSWFGGGKGNGSTAESWSSARQSEPDAESMSLSVQLFTTASHGTLRCAAHSAAPSCLSHVLCFSPAAVLWCMLPSALS